jgi:hypothetical protein
MRLVLSLILYFVIVGVSAQTNINQVIGEVNVDSLFRTVRDLSGDQPVVINGSVNVISSRYYNDAGNAIAQQYISSRLMRYGWNYSSQPFGLKGLNIIARKQGMIYPNRKVIIGAHFDSMPNNISPGADDNASGVAAILEMARIISQLDLHFPVTIELAFWDEEEVGLLGSKAHVGNLSERDTVLAVINLDMLAWDGNSDGVVNIHTRPGGINETLVSIADESLQYAQGLTAQMLWTTAYPSDHVPFLDAGYPAIALTEDYVNDLNPSWHTSSDLTVQFDSTYFLQASRWALATLLNVVWHPLPVNVPGTTDVVAMSLSPNPTSDKMFLYIMLNEPLIEAEIFVAGVDGAKTFSIHTGSLQAGFSVFEINVTNLSAGMYLVALVGDTAHKKHKISRKIVKAADG